MASASFTRRVARIQTFAKDMPGRGKDQVIAIADVGAAMTTFSVLENL